MLRPRLRALHFQSTYRAGEPMWLLNDPWRLSDRQLLFPAPLAQLLLYCDGGHTLSQIHRRLCADLSGYVPYEAVTAVVEQLDELYLLDNDRSRQAIAKALAAYRAQSYRPPALAGLGYPAEAEALSRLLEGYTADSPLAEGPVWRGRGLISPHIDYPRGGSVYAQVWQRAAAAVQAADLVIILGTDHHGGAASLTLTRLPYATPYGVLPTDPAVVEHLARAVGPQAFDLELNHRQEHAIELSAVWLHHLRRENPCPMVPVLCGALEHLTPAGHPRQEAHLIAFIQALREATAGRRALVVASVDLAHVGPAFDTDYRMDAARRAALQATDASLCQAICQGDAERFYQEIAATRNAHNICGFSSIYLLLKYLGATNGVEVAYAQCPADAEDASVVSICGLLLA